MNEETISKAEFKIIVRACLKGLDSRTESYEPRVDSHYARAQNRLISPDGTERMYHRVYTHDAMAACFAATRIVGEVNLEEAVTLSRIYINPSPTLANPERWLASVMTIEQRESE